MGKGASEWRAGRWKGVLCSVEVLRLGPFARRDSSREAKEGPWELAWNTACRTLDCGVEHGAFLLQKKKKKKLTAPVC